MRGVQEIYTQSLFNDSACLWPQQLFNGLKKVYVFEREHVFEKKCFTAAFESSEKYVLILSPVDADFVEGIYNRETGIAILNEKLISTKSFPIAQVLQLQEDTDDESKDLMVRYLQEKEISLLQSAKEKLTMARYYNDGIREIHDSAIKEKVVNEIKDDLIHKVFQEKKGNIGNTMVDKAYFGTNAANGPLYMTHFQDDINCCFILKGQGTSVVSKILNELAFEADKRGFNTFLYYCPFYTQEIDCIVIPELKTVVLDSEPPHHVEPLHPNEMVITIGEKCTRSETLFSHSHELRELEAKYKQFMRQAVLNLQDYRKYKHQEMNLSNKYKDITVEKMLEILNG